MKTYQKLLIATTATAGFFGAALAAAPEAYQGRTLPGVVKELVWQKACNLPDADEVDCSSGVCKLTRSDGNRFKPATAAWQTVLMFEWSAAERTFGPAFTESKTPGLDDIQGSMRVALELASGLPLQAKSAEDGPLTLNPALVRWAQRELLPMASEPMCGGTATELYREAFQPSVRAVAEVYAALKAQGLTRGVTVKALSRSFDTGQGKFTKACSAIAQKIGGDGEYSRVAECWWWLRRVATGTAEPIADLVGEVLRRYDPDEWTKIGKAFPKPAAPN